MPAGLAFLPAAPRFLLIPPRVFKRTLHPLPPLVAGPRRLRAVACDRNAPMSSASGAHGPAGSKSKDPERGRNSVSRTLLGRAVVEVLSLVVGAALLLVVVVWRASQVVSQAAWRALLWLSNLRRLGKWAVGRVAQTQLPGDLPWRIVRNAFARLASRPPMDVSTVSAPPREASGVDVDQLVSKEELDHVQREIDRMKDIISSKGASSVEEDEHVVSAMVKARRMILVRHAKTQWDRGSDTPDHDRVLSAQGKEQARHVGSELISRAWVPDAVLCSDSVRTVQTLSLLNVPEKEGQSGTVCTESLYYAVTGEEMAVAVDDALGENGFPDQSTLMVVCHNPGCEELVEQLTGHRPEMGTGCAALLEFKNDETINDEELSNAFQLTPQENKWQLVEVLRP